MSNLVNEKIPEYKSINVNTLYQIAEYLEYYRDELKIRLQEVMDPDLQKYKRYRMEADILFKDIDTLVKLEKEIRP